MQPVIGILVAYVAGLLVGPFIDVEALPQRFWLIPFALLPLWLFFRQRRIPGTVLLVMLLFSIALTRAVLLLSPPQDLSRIDRYAGSDPVVVEGTVIRVQASGRDRSRIDFAAQKVGERGIFAQVTGHVRLYLADDAAGLLPGDRIRFRSRLRRTRSFGTPGEFDMPRHLAYSGIWTTAYLPDRSALVVYADGAPGLLRSIARWRHACSILIERSVEGAMAPFVRALTLGERGALEVDQRRRLAASGVAHLFAISGLHLGLLALFLYRLLLPLYRQSRHLLLWKPPRRVLPIVLLPVLFGYLLLTGDALSTRRAFAACLCVAVFLLSRRQVAPPILLASIALIFLLLEPLALWQASFQLSFAGAFGIISWRRYWQNIGGSTWWPIKKGAQLLVVSLAAITATTPLVLLHFHQISLAGLLNNLIAIPPVTFLAVPLGLLGVATSSVFPAVATFLFLGCSLVLEFVLRATDWVASLSGLGAMTIYFSRGEWLAVAIGVFLLFVPLRRGYRAAAMLLLLALVSVPLRGGTRLSLTAFSVGQGESILISFDDSRHILVDGGGLYGDSFDVGERLLAPALGALDVDRLDAVLLTHNHPDHSKGLVYLLDKFSVGQFWYAGSLDDVTAALRQVLTVRNIPVRQFSHGWTDLPGWGSVELAVFVPRREGRAENDRSVVVSASLGQESVLLTGDLEQTSTAELLSTGRPALVSLLKIPHHGSRHSGAQQLIEAYSPAHALVSVGYRNRYRLPSSTVSALVDRSGGQLYRTDLDGTLRFVSSGFGWEVKHWENGLFR